MAMLGQELRPMAEKIQARLRDPETLDGFWYGGTFAFVGFWA